MSKFLWGNIAGKAYTIGTCLILGALVVCIPNSANEFSFSKNILIGFFIFGFWLLLGTILVTLYNLVGGKG